MFFVFNIYFDYWGDMACFESVKLILWKICSIVGEVLVMLIGDFNCGLGLLFYNVIMVVSSLVEDVMYCLEMFYYGLNVIWMDSFKVFGIGEWIDYIFVIWGVIVYCYVVLLESWGGWLLLDYLFVFVELELLKD